MKTRGLAAGAWHRDCVRRATTNASFAPGDGPGATGTERQRPWREGNKWLFGGTVYQADGTTPAPHVQVGVRDGTALYNAYSATNGNFWFADTGTGIDWTNAEVRFRNASGESTMISPATAACNQCHTGGLVMKEP